MDRRNQGLLVFAIGILIVTVIMQRARSALTPEQLYALERAQKFSIRTLAPAVPLFISMLTVSCFPKFQVAQATGALAVSVIWFILDAFDSRKRMLQAGLPARYATAAFWSTAILIASIVVAVGVAASSYLL